MIRKTIDVSQVEFASHGQRIFARAIDMIIVSAFFTLFIVVAGIDFNEDAKLFEDLGLGYWVWMLPLFYLAYEIPSVASRGQTLGKRIMGICIVRTDGEIGIGLDRSTNRFLVLAICNLIPFIGLLGLVWFVFDPLRQNLPDKAARTYVVRTPEGLYSKNDYSEEEFQTLDDE